MHGLICMALSIRARSDVSIVTNYIPSSQSCMYRYYYDTLATPDSHRVLHMPLHCVACACGCVQIPPHHCPMCADPTTPLNYVCRSRHNTALSSHVLVPAGVPVQAGASGGKRGRQQADTDRALSPPFMLVRPSMLAPV
jgi:hypothetical protein